MDATVVPTEANKAVSHISRFAGRDNHSTSKKLHSQNKHHCDNNNRGSMLVHTVSLLCLHSTLCNERRGESHLHDHM